MIVDCGLSARHRPEAITDTSCLTSLKYVCSKTPNQRLLLFLSLLQRMRGASQRKCLSNSSLCVPEDAALARSASLSHRSTLLLWQTGRLTSFIPVAPLCSSSSQTIRTITSLVSAWLHSVPRCFLLIWRSALVDISAPALCIHLQENALNTQQRAVKTSEKVRGQI